MPGDLPSLAEVLLLRESMQSFLGGSDVHKLDGPDDADIDSGTVADMIAEGRFTESDFNDFCESFAISPRNPDGTFHDIASQAFLQRFRGVEIMSLTLPSNNAVADIYMALVDFARKRNLRIYCPMPHCTGDIDLDNPGELPPRWQHFLER